MRSDDSAVLSRSLLASKMRLCTLNILLSAAPAALTFDPLLVVFLLMSELFDPAQFAPPP